jgi:hypothetical protein
VAARPPRGAHGGTQALQAPTPQIRRTPSHRNKHHHPNEKGTSVTHPEHSSETPHHQTGIFATLRAFLRPGTGAPSSGRRRRRLVAVSVAALALTLTLAAPGLADGGPPTIEPLQANSPLTLEEPTIGATRANLYTTVSTNGSEVQWRLEYATSESGKYSLAEEGGVPPAAGKPEVEPHMRHLTPNTTYYVRFVAKNANGEAAVTTKFTTLPVSAPEVMRSVRGCSVCVRGVTSFKHVASTITSLGFQAGIQANGAEAEYRFEYATSKSGSYTVAPGCSGTITEAEEAVQAKCTITGLTPETAYYIRLTATNAHGAAEPVEEIREETTSVKPRAANAAAGNVTGTAARLRGEVGPATYETDWRFESTTEPANPASWAPVPGAAGTIPSAEAGEESYAVEGDLTGLAPATVYYVRLVAHNANGERTTGPVSFQTAGRPALTAFATHALHGEDIRLLGNVAPNDSPIDELQTLAIGGAPTGGAFILTFKGQTTAAIPYNAGRNKVQEALGALGANIVVRETARGHFTVEFRGLIEDGPLAGANQPQLEADSSGLTPSGAVSVATLEDGSTPVVHYHFQYVSESDFGKPAPEGEWAKAQSAPDVTGSGIVGQDVPALGAGEAYRYRLLGENELGQGSPSASQALTVPALAITGSEGPCPNLALRSGLSANLPDCRAYEQLTPVEKEGSLEPFNYGVSNVEGAVVGEDGNHLALANAQVDWGAAPHSGQGPYFFTRTASGWRMTAAAVQPQTGVNRVSASVFSPNLTAFAFESNSHTSGGSGESAVIEFAAGSPGGPYAGIPVPRKLVGGGGAAGIGNGWVAASEGFSKLILQVEDHELLGKTATKSGADLYEYLAGELRQANVTSTGEKIGTCGASIVNGAEEHGRLSSRHAVSADGSRVFFEAVPGTNCSAPSHLYMREVAAARTLDLGPYRFRAANAQGAEVLLEARNGEAWELFLYNTETAAAKHLLTTHKALTISVSQDFTAIYFSSTEALTPEAPPPSPQTGEAAEDLYRYDVSAETLSFLAQLGQGVVVRSSPDGRYAYFDGPETNGFDPPGTQGVAGVPGGAVAKYYGGEARTSQVYRYDSVAHLIQCISCASPFDPEPAQSSVLNQNNSRGRELLQSGLPDVTLASANGNFAFFSTPAALVPQDVDGEVTPEKECAGHECVNASFGEEISPSSDVYEWRAPGIDGCAHPQGCLALITSGRGGFLNLLLGTANEGRDVFIYTRSQLLPQDKDTSGDIYDVRIGGGFAGPPPPPVECEADACSTPPSPPNDATPSSLAFSGAGNLVPEISAAVKPKAKQKCKAKAKRKCKARARKKRKKTRARHASKPSAKRRG